MLSRVEALQVIENLPGTSKLMVQIMYGSGLRVMETLRLRVKELDFANQHIVVRDGKGEKDRLTILPKKIIHTLNAHLLLVKGMHEKDLLKAHRTELFVLLDNVSAAINDVFETAELTSIREFLQLKSDLEKLAACIHSSKDIPSIEVAITMHKDVYKKINEIRLSFPQRKELRVELERLWSDDDGISEKLRKYKRGRFIGDQLEQTVKSLMNEGRLLLISDVPRI